MTDRNSVWIDPNDCGLSTVEAAEQKRRDEAERQHRADIKRKRMEEKRRERVMKRNEEERPKTQALTVQPQPEILPPARETLAPPLASMATALDLSHFERQVREAANMLDLSVPEGFLDRCFSRPDHRIDVKTERGRRLAIYIAACTAILEAARAHQAARHQMYLDQLMFLRRVAEENYNIEFVRSRAERQDAIEAAQARETIATHEGSAREHNLRGRPPAPPPPPPQLPAPVDEVARRREDARRKKQEILDLDLQELDLKADAGQEKVTRAKAKATEIFQNVSLSGGEVRARIQEVLDAYNLDWTILPVRIREFMEGEAEKENLER